MPAGSSISRKMRKASSNQAAAGRASTSMATAALSHDHQHPRLSAAAADPPEELERLPEVHAAPDHSRVRSPPASLPRAAPWLGADRVLRGLPRARARPTRRASGCPIVNHG